MRVLRERVESGRAGDLRAAKTGSGKHQEVAMGPNLSRWREGTWARGRGRIQVPRRLSMGIGELLDYLSGRETRR